MPTSELKHGYVPSSDDPVPYGGSRPPGVLPKNVQYLVFGAVAVLILAMSFCSGHQAQQTDTSVPSIGPSAAQLSGFRQLLEKQRRDAEEEKRRLEELQLRNQDPFVPNGSQFQRFAAEPDPFIQARRAREEAAPFASSVAVRSNESTATAHPDLASQIVVSVEEEEAPKPNEIDSPRATADANESGRFLPAKEGKLFRLFEGTTIQTELANQLDGSFTGPVKCMVTQTIRSKDGSAVLIPEGSWFIGEAMRVEAQNQARLAVVFKRLLLPNNYSIDLKAAPGLDRSGQTGLKDKVNNHRTRTFSIAGAIGLLGGLAGFGGRGNPYAWGVSNSMGNSATNALSHYLNAVPTITIRKGHPVIVYLPNDLLVPEYRP